MHTTSKAFEAIPDSIWLHILGFLDGNVRDLFAVIESKLTDSAVRAATDESLWRRITITQGASASTWSYSELRRIVPALSKGTRSIRIVANDKGAAKKSHAVLSATFLQSVRLRCTKLDSFALINCKFDWHDNLLGLLPASLKTLELKKVTLVNLPKIRSVTASPFYGLRKRLPQLQELHLQETNWVSKVDLACAKKSESLSIFGADIDPRRRQVE